MAIKIRPPKTADLVDYLRRLFLYTEQELLAEITRKRRRDLVDYAEVASLERVQGILTNMVDETFTYAPTMIEKIFYRSDKDAAGYRNARSLTSAQTEIVEVLASNLIGEVMEMAETAEESVKELYTIGRLENDNLRGAALSTVARQEAAGSGWTAASAKMTQELKNKGITAYVDKAGRNWSISDYGNMAVRTTARQAEVAAVLSSSEDDLWQISSVGSTCPVCAPLEGRVYSKSGLNPNYPPLTLAFGKVDKNGPDDLSNTYLNIHPNCLHALMRYTTKGKTPEQIQKDIDFSDPTLNPITRDPRTKKQIAAYKAKERQRRKLLNDIKQWKRYKSVLGGSMPKTYATFQKHKLANDDTYKKWMREYRAQNKEIKKALGGD